MKHTIWQGRPWQAFKNFALIFSFAVNLVLLVALLLLGRMVLPIANDVAEPIVGGLNESFVDMGQARIVQTIDVKDEIPISFTVPLSTTTIVTTTAPVGLNVPAQFALPDGGGSIFGTAVLQLPAGLPLPVELNVAVPVEQRIPVELAVDVDIPLAETELGPPFSRLQELFSPLHRLLQDLPQDNDELMDRLRPNSVTNSNLAPPSP